jgi:hypothetical protein
MKMTLAVGLIAMVALVGCKKSEPGGGAGNDTFKVVVPAIGAEVKQGEVQTVRVSVERTGLKVEPASTTVKPGDKGDVQLTITAATDAPLGEAKVMLRGTPDQGAPAEVEFKITVSAK